MKLGKYTLLNTLQSRQAHTTYEVKQKSGQGPFILKVLDVGFLKHLKNIELFEREIDILKKLKHAQIPRFIEHFKIETESGVRLCLVTQKKPGKTLQALLNEGWRPTDEEIMEIACQILDILKYLEKEGVIHRDIKPSNILRSKEGVIALIDFGAIQDIFRPLGGTTVVGTFGYMAPEQYSGKSMPNSDIYSLGALILTLFTGKSPSDIPRIGLALDFKPLLKASQEWQDWLTQCLAPQSSKRFFNAEHALQSLLLPQKQVAQVEKIERQNPVGGIYIEEENELKIVSKGIRWRVFFYHFILSGFLPALFVFAISMIIVSNLGFIIPAFIGFAPSALVLGCGLYIAIYHGCFKKEMVLTPKLLEWNQANDAVGFYSMIAGAPGSLNLYYETNSLSLENIKSVEIHKKIGQDLTLNDKDWVIMEGLSLKEVSYIQAKVLEYLNKNPQGNEPRNLLLQLKIAKQRNRDKWNF